MTCAAAGMTATGTRTFVMAATVAPVWIRGAVTSSVTRATDRCCPGYGDDWRGPAGCEVDTFDALAAELAELTRRIDEARAAVQNAERPPFDGTTFSGDPDREDDLRALRNFAALVQFGVPRHLPYVRRPRRPTPLMTPPSGIPYPRRPTDAV